MLNGFRHVAQLGGEKFGQKTVHVLHGFGISLREIGVFIRSAETDTKAFSLFLLVLPTQQNVALYSYLMMGLLNVAMVKFE